MIVVHGGSWSGGTKGDLVTWNRWLASSGRVVFDIEYRLVDAQTRFPVPLADVKCAIGWVKQHAFTYNVDPNSIALLGRSAGGQLALLAAYSAADPALPASCDAPDTTVSAVISLYGPADLVWGYNHPAHPDIINGPRTLERYLGGTPTTAPEIYRLAAPIEHVSPSTPPTLLIHGGHDQLVGYVHATRLLGRLVAAGVEHRYLFLPWANHGFDYHFDGWHGQLAQSAIAQFLDDYLPVPVAAVRGSPVP
ncbi:MAG: hypothetical protein NVS2B7_03540 [Herpetosiphon sp.]